MFPVWFPVHPTLCSCGSMPPTGQFPWLYVPHSSIPMDLFPRALFPWLYVPHGSVFPRALFPWLHVPHSSVPTALCSPQLCSHGSSPQLCSHGSMFHTGLFPWLYVPHRSIPMALCSHSSLLFHSCSCSATALRSHCSFSCLLFGCKFLSFHSSLGSSCSASVLASSRCIWDLDLDLYIVLFAGTIFAMEMGEHNANKTCT